MTGRYKAYPKYKRFNSTWFDSLPSHWQSVSMKWITNLYAGGTPSKDNLSFWENGSIPWLNSGSVNQSVIKKPSAFITRDAFNNSSAKWIPKGSLVMALAGQGKTKGMVAQLAIESTCNQSMAAIVPSQIVSPRFLFWWLTSNYQKIRNMAGGDLRDGLNLDLLGNISCPIFECKEQQKIANFLDHETAKIDTLIAKQEKLIELLKEKRQAVISHAVTKGLNPDAPMKDSGVEWLGEVPEHWNVGALKYITSIYGRIGFRGYTTSDIVDEGNGAITMSPSNISNGVVSFDKATYLSWEKYYESPEIQLNQDDVVLVKTGSTLGKAGYIDELVTPTTLNPQLAVFKDTLCCNKWLYYFLNTALVKAYVDNSNSGGTVPTMSQEKILSYLAPIPSLEEQREIANHLDSLITKIDNLTVKQKNMIDLMIERKTALISAAVTGKIDVRDWSGDC